MPRDALWSRHLHLIKQLWKNFPRLTVLMLNGGKHVLLADIFFWNDVFTRFFKNDFIYFKLLHISHDCIVQLWEKKSLCSKPGFTIMVRQHVHGKKRFWLCCNMDFIYCLYVFIIKTHIYAWAPRLLHFNNHLTSLGKHFITCTKIDYYAYTTRIIYIIWN